MKSPINVLHLGGHCGSVGSFVTRSVVDMPAWQRVGPVAWATFSRQADLRNGEVLYPILGIGSTVLAVALAAVYRLNRAVPKSAAVPLYSSALFAIGVILATMQAAPQMLKASPISETMRWRFNMLSIHSPCGRRSGPLVSPLGMSATCGLCWR